MNVSYSIMAHDDRAWMVDRLLDELGDIPVAWDGGVSEWHTGARAWNAHDRHATWHVVVQDDAILCDDFVERSTEFLASCSPDHPASFYLGSGRPRQSLVRSEICRAENSGSDRIRLNSLLWGVCVALPVSHVEDMLKKCQIGDPHYDIRISRYYGRRRANTTYSWPSLVDHRDEKSLVHDKVSVSRVAHRFAGSSRDWGKLGA